MIKNRHRDRRAFVLGSGPSLNGHDLSWLAGEITVGANKVYLATREAGWVPRYLCVTDPVMAQFVAEDYAGLDAQVVMERRAVERSGYLAYNLALIADIVRPYVHGAWTWDVESPMVQQESRSVIAALALPLAVWLGCNPIYLLGCDCTANGHAYDAIEEARHDNHPPDTFRDLHLPAFELARREAERIGVAVFNAGKGGALEAFPRCDYEALRP